MLKHFIYKFNEGPVSSKEELLSNWDFVNCRKAVQLYFLNERGIFLNPNQVLCPESYNKTGEFVVTKNQDFSSNLLISGDIIYAEKIRDKNNETVDKGPHTFTTEDEYLISLHTAIFTGEKDKEVWHATAIEGSSCFWPLEKFLYFYHPIAVKRIT